MRPSAGLLSAGIVALSCALIPAAGTGAPAQVVHVVTIDGVSFHPGSLHAHPGDTVRWINKDPFAHTVKAKDGSFASPEIPPEGSWQLKLQKADQLNYFCTLHPTMQATLIVR